MFDRADHDGQRHESVPDRESRTARRTAIEDEINTVLASINAAQAQLCELIEEHEREGMWHDNDGVRSEAAYLTWRAGLMPWEANRYLQVSRKLAELPHLKASFSSGKLSLSQVASVASIAVPETDQELTELAENLSAHQLSTVTSYYRKVFKQGEDPGKRREVRFHYTEHGQMKMRSEMPADQGVVIERAIKAIADGLPLDQDADDPWAARYADALCLLAENGLSGEIQTRSGPDAFKAIVHVDVSALQDGEGDCYIQDAASITPETALRIMCDSQVAVMTEKDGQPLNVGRSSRTFKGAVRLALEARDKMCQWPGCGSKLHLQNHHIKHWVRDHGETSVDNGIRLCWFHHRKLHEGGVRMERDGNDWRFITPDGTVIARPPPRPATSTTHELNEQRGVKIDEQTCRPGWHGEKGNLRHVADIYVEKHWDIHRERGWPGPN